MNSWFISACGGAVEMLQRAGEWQNWRDVQHVSTFFKRASESDLLTYNPLFYVNIVCCAHIQQRQRAM